MNYLPNMTNILNNLFLDDLEEVSKDKSPSYRVIPIKTSYIKPGEPYDVIIDVAKDLLENGDFLLISETPIAISQGRLVDEARFKPSKTAFFLAEIWSKYIWGYLLGPLLGLKRRTTDNLKNLPPEARAHKEVVLRYYGLRHALKPASEAGMDLSNAPGTFVSLLPDAPQKVVEDISKKISTSVGKDIIVMIIDTDATYQLGGMKFTSIPVAVSGIKCDLGIFGYILGRFGKIIGPTPLAISKAENIDKIINIAKIAEKYREQNYKDIKTVYDMANVFDEEMTGITIEMLDSIEHTPAVIVRKLE